MKEWKPEEKEKFEGYYVCIISWNPSCVCTCWSKVLVDEVLGLVAYDFPAAKRGDCLDPNELISMYGPSVDNSSDSQQQKISSQD